MLDKIVSCQNITSRSRDLDVITLSEYLDSYHLRQLHPVDTNPHVHQLSYRLLQLTAVYITVGVQSPHYITPVLRRLYCS